MGRCAAEGCTTQTKGTYCFAHAEGGSAGTSSPRTRCREKWCRAEPVAGADYCVKHSRGAVVVVKAAPKVAVTRPVNPAQADGDVLATLDERIGVLQADVATLERAKAILSRG